MSYGDGPAPVGTLAATLKQLEHEERHLSSIRRRLHEQIDNGFPNELTMRREREISAQRRALHQEIDHLRLGLAEAPPAEFVVRAHRDVQKVEPQPERKDTVPEHKNAGSFGALLGADWEEVEPGIFVSAKSPD
jgi:hypothetical protein